jgi:hypothetical protein
MLLTGAAEAESPWWMGRMQQALQAQFREGSDGRMHGDVQQHFHNQTSEHFFREVAEGLPNGHDEGFENLFGTLNPGNQALPFSRADVDARAHNSYLQGSTSLPPLWCAHSAPHLPLSHPVVLLCTVCLMGTEL